jgi:DNA-binding MarR family transcriptional regulator
VRALDELGQHLACSVAAVALWEADPEAHLDVLQYPGPENRRPSDLAVQTQMSRQAMNYLLGQMEALGYLTRDDDPEDQRSKRIHLTDRGHAAARTIREIVRQVETEWEQQLSPQRFAQFRDMLTQLQPDSSRE